MQKHSRHVRLLAHLTPDVMSQLRVFGDGEDDENNPDQVTQIQIREVINFDITPPLHKWFQILSLEKANLTYAGKAVAVGSKLLLSC